MSAPSLKAQPSLVPCSPYYCLHPHTQVAVHPNKVVLPDVGSLPLAQQVTDGPSSLTSVPTAGNSHISLPTLHTSVAGATSTQVGVAFSKLLASYMSKRVSCLLSRTFITPHKKHGLFA